MNGNEKSAVLNIFRTVPFPYKKYQINFLQPSIKTWIASLISNRRIIICYSERERHRHIPQHSSRQESNKLIYKTHTIWLIISFNPCLKQSFDYLSLYLKRKPLFHQCAHPSIQSALTAGHYENKPNHRCSVCAATVATIAIFQRNFHSHPMIGEYLHRCRICNTPYH